ncbi:MAG: hypothetical protein COA50_15665 [Flavobacteriaceae bacterium]|nr:MAG: hypothetical protein COA50_15665 [Flavobacteriaceae bacterium]
MCYHTALREKQKEVYEQVFDIHLNLESELLPLHFHQNGFDRQNVLIITQEDSEHVQLAKWGIAPPESDIEAYWKKVGGGSLNNRDDKFFTTAPEWKDESLLYKKCLIIVDGLYEPHKVSNAKPIPYLFEQENQALFALLGIYTEHDEMFTCSVITTSADPLFEEIHNGAKRMPMCVDPLDKDYYLNMTKEHDIRAEFINFRSIKLNAHPVNRDALNSHVKSDREDIVEKVYYPELDSLF